MQKKIREECTLVLNGKSLSQVDNKDLKQMIYLEGFLNEVLRLKTPAVGIIIRETNADVKVENFTIKKSKQYF
jgi:cytochrome P450